MTSAVTRPRAIGVAVAFLAGVGLLTGCGTTQLALDRPAAGLLPTEVDGYSVSATPEAQDFANQLKALAPGITESSGATLQKDGQASGLDVYALKGSRNGLNAVTLTLVRNAGAGREGDAWGAAEQGEKYQHSTSEINGVAIDEVSTVSEGDRSENRG